MIVDQKGAYPENLKTLTGLDHTLLQMPVPVLVGASAGASAQFFSLEN